MAGLGGFGGAGSHGLPRCRGAQGALADVVERADCRFGPGFAGAGKIEFLRCHVSAFQWSRAAVLRALDQAAGRRLVALILPRRSSVRS